MATLHTLRDWLASMDETELAAVIERNPLVLSGARVRDLDELAARLTHPAAVSENIWAVPMPLVEVVEAVSALGAAATVTRLGELLDDHGVAADAHREGVDRWLQTAASAALLWIDGDHIRLNPGIDELVLMPLAIAASSRMLLSEFTSDDLARILKSWRRTIPARKAERLAAVSELFADFPAIRRIASQAPDQLLDHLTTHVNQRLTACRSVIAYAADGERLGDNDDFYGSFDFQAYQARHELWEWAASVGIAFRRGYGFSRDAEMPSEVYLALAPSGFHAPFHPEPPPLTRVAASAEQVDRASSAAAAQFLGGAMAILEAVARNGIKKLKSGGVGARELARFAKQIGSDIPTVRMTLALADRMGLLGTHYGATHIETVDQFEQWRRLRPEQRMLDLVLAWFSPGAAPTRERDEAGTYLPVMKDRTVGSGIPTAYVLAEILAEHPGEAAASGEAAADEVAASAEEVVQRIVWRQPIAGSEQDALRCNWSEGHLLGVLVDGALAPFAQALCHADHLRALNLLAALLPEQSNEVMFGSDLTIVIAGNPAADVVDVLDTVATREGHGVANTWRVTEASVRDALDAGYAVHDLIAALRTIAGQELPQALDYLLRDVARKHGRLGVRRGAAVVTSDDEALLAEVVHTRHLHKLELRLVAPTVAITTADVAQVLHDLRGAGYLPREVDAGGESVVELRHLPAVASPMSSDAGRDEADRDGTDLDGTQLAGEMAAFLKSAGRERAATPTESSTEVAHRLLSPAGDDADTVPAESENSIAEHARQLSSAEIYELADSVAAGRAVQIRYRSQSGNETVRTVSELEILGSTLYGFCHLRNGERHFRLDRILSVAPNG